MTREEYKAERAWWADLKPRLTRSESKEPRFGRDIILRVEDRAEGIYIERRVSLDEIKEAEAFMDRERVVDLYCSELEDQMRRDYPAVLAEKNRILADKAQAALAVVRALDDLMRRAGLKGTLTFHGADAPPFAFVGGKP